MLILFAVLGALAYLALGLAYSHYRAPQWYRDAHYKLDRNYLYHSKSYLKKKTRGYVKTCFFWTTVGIVPVLLFHALVFLSKRPARIFKRIGRAGGHYFDSRDKVSR